MPTIDGYSAVGNNPNLQSLRDDDIDTRPAEAGHRQVVLSADGQTYLKTEGSAPVPAFAGPPQVDRDHAGKAALQVMHEHVRTDVNQLSSAWQGPGSGAVGINYSELIEVLVKLDSEQAKSSREARTYQYKEIAATQMQGAEDLRKAGQLEFIGSMVSSSMTMAAGFVQIGSSASAMGGGEAAGAGESAEAAGESIEGSTEAIEGVGETNASPVEEEETTTSFSEGAQLGQFDGSDPAGEASGDLGPDDTTAETEAELEQAAARAQSGESAEGPNDTTAETEADAGADEAAEQEQELTEQKDKAGREEQRKDLFDDDTKKLMKQFSRDTHANVGAQASQAKLSLGTGLAQGFQGMGTAGKGAADLGASELRAKEKEEQAIAAEQQAVMQQETDYGKSAEENAKKMMDIYDAIAQSRDASMQRVVSA
ncbi:MAG: hypothetical protein OXI88_02690 [Gammaproteobacteria bacterium]|nr:hypothetical protein [Gammaproteobacteria bacterium]MDE0282982.1 hypothetical protein [Gammaproteobacteria bacterium]MDE0510679.1 hypothetical protein [Gammaproteobacteria bacterium]